MTIRGGANGLHRAYLRAERAWHSGSAPWWFLLVEVAVTAALAASSTFAWKRVASQEVGLRAQQVQSTLAQGTQASPVASAPAYTDFVQTLPIAIDIQGTLSTVYGAAADAGVVLSSIQLQPRGGAQELLARTELTVSARGPYPKLKQVTYEVLARYPNATLAHLSLRRGGAPDQLETTIVIDVWGAPTAVASAASAPTAGTP